MKSFVWYGPAIREEKGMAYYQSLDIVEHQRTSRYALGDNVYLRSRSRIGTSTFDSAFSSSHRVGKIKSFFQSKFDDQKQVEILWYLSPAQLREREGQLLIDLQYDEQREIFSSEECSVQPIQSIVKKCSIRTIFYDEENVSEKDNSYSSISSNNNEISDKSSSSISNNDWSKENGIETNFYVMSLMRREHDDFICRYHYKNAGATGESDSSIISKVRGSSNGGKSENFGLCQRSYPEQVENGADNMVRDISYEDTATTKSCCQSNNSDREEKKRKHRDNGMTVHRQPLPIKGCEHKTTSMDETTSACVPLSINATGATSVPHSQVKIMSKVESIEAVAFKLLCDDVRFEILQQHSDKSESQLNSIFLLMWEELTEASRKNYTSRAKKRFLRASKRARRKLLQSSKSETDRIFKSNGNDINIAFDSHEVDHTDENNDLEVEIIANNTEVQRRVHVGQMNSPTHHGVKEFADLTLMEEGCSIKLKLKEDTAITRKKLPEVSKAVPVYLDMSAYTANECCEDMAQRDRDNELEILDSSDAKFRHNDKKWNRNGEHGAMNGYSQSGSSSSSKNVDGRGLNYPSSSSSSSPSSSSFLSSADSSAASSKFSSASPSPIHKIRSPSPLPLPPVPLVHSKINGDVSEINVIDSGSRRTCAHRKPVRNEDKRKHSEIFLSNEKKINKFFNEKKDFVMTPEIGNSLRSRHVKSRLESGREKVDNTDVHAYISPLKSPEMRPIVSPSYLSFLSSPASHINSHSNASPHHRTPRVGSNYQITVGSYYDELRGDAENDRYLLSGATINNLAQKSSSTVCDVPEENCKNKCPPYLCIDESIDTTTLDNCSSSSKNSNRNSCSKCARKSGYFGRALHCSLPLSGVSAASSTTAENILNEGLVWTCSRKNYSKLLSDSPHNGCCDSRTADRLNVANTVCSNNNLLSANYYHEEFARLDTSAGGYRAKDFIERSEVNIEGYVVCALNMIEQYRKHRVLRSQIHGTFEHDPNTRYHTCSERQKEISPSACVDDDTHWDDRQIKSSSSLPHTLCKGSWIYLRTGALEHILETLHIWDYCRSAALEALRRELVDDPQLTTIPCLSSLSNLNGLSSESSSSSPAVALIHAEPSIATPYSTSSFYSSSSSSSHGALLVEWYQWEIEQMQTTFAKFGDDLSIMIASVPTKTAAEVTEYYFRFVYSAVQIEHDEKNNVQ